MQPYCAPNERNTGALERTMGTLWALEGALGPQCKRIVSKFINALIVRPRKGTFALMMRSWVWVQYERMLPYNL